ncbi:MAG: hypothetical protein IPJ13_08160 [Saprospiraceae bacterium]|nr:hypothetical protein [Saprospiraceae bacterium]
MRTWRIFPRPYKNKANTIDEFDRELEKNNSGHYTDKEHNIINLQIAAIIFDNKGDL